VTYGARERRYGIAAFRSRLPSHQRRVGPSPDIENVPHYGPVGYVRSGAQKCNEVLREIEV
jgi:hypothetical protein